MGQQVFLRVFAEAGARLRARGLAHDPTPRRMLSNTASDALTILWPAPARRPEPPPGRRGNSSGPGPTPSPAPWFFSIRPLPSPPATGSERGSIDPARSLYSAFFAGAGVEEGKSGWISAGIALCRHAGCGDWGLIPCRTAMPQPFGACSLWPHPRMGGRHFRRTG